METRTPVGHPLALAALWRVALYYWADFTGPAFIAPAVSSQVEREVMRQVVQLGLLRHPVREGAARVRAVLQVAPAGAECGGERSVAGGSIAGRRAYLSLHVCIRGC
jgi:hypothetical protein